LRRQFLWSSRKKSFISWASGLSASVTGQEGVLFSVMKNRAARSSAGNQLTEESCHSAGVGSAELTRKAGLSQPTPAPQVVEKYRKTEA
jgi:hypothetical protein